MKRSLLRHLEAILASFSSGERRVAEYVLAHPEKVIHLSIADMRRQSGKSLDAILGFCRRLGLKGYSDLKITLALELGRIPPRSAQPSMMGHRDSSETSCRRHSESVDNKLLTKHAAGC
jgi:DNA-binding MurR/RpiR family transcriptional regulator